MIFKALALVHFLLLQVTFQDACDHIHSTKRSNFHSFGNSLGCDGVSEIYLGAYRFLVPFVIVAF